MVNVIMGNITNDYSENNGEFADCLIKQYNFFLLCIYIYIFFQTN